jgi:hypothetical protein
MDIILRHAWALFLVATFMNALIYRLRSYPHIARDGSLAAGYRSLIWGYLLSGVLPWAIVGLGVVSGGLPSTASLFHPREGNPYVAAFYLSVLAILALATYWMFHGGAEAVVRHPGLMNIDMKNPGMLKLVWCLMVFGSVLGAVGLWTSG